MRVECRCAVGADDAQVLQPIVVAHAVDVVEDQPHGAASPKVVLTAELTDRRLATFCVEALLEEVAGERGVLDEDRFERCAPWTTMRWRFEPGSRKARWHERMFAATPDGSPPEPGSREGNWGARDRTRT